MVFLTAWGAAAEEVCVETRASTAALKPPLAEGFYLTGDCGTYEVTREQAKHLRGKADIHRFYAGRKGQYASSGIPDLGGLEYEYQYPLDPQGQPDFTGAATKLTEVCADEKGSRGQYLDCLDRRAQIYSATGIAVQNDLVEHLRSLETNFPKALRCPAKFQTATADQCNGTPDFRPQTVCRAGTTMSATQLLELVDPLCNGWGHRQRLLLGAIASACPLADVACVKLAEQIRRLAHEDTATRDLSVRLQILARDYRAFAQIPESVVALHAPDPRVRRPGETEDGKGSGTGDAFSLGRGQKKTPKPIGPPKLSDKARSIDGVVEGLAKGQDCPPGVACSALSLIKIRDPGPEGTGTVIQCPAFLSQYNCLALGSGAEGDLLRIGTAPEFARDREDYCQKKVRRYLLVQGPSAPLWIHTAARKLRHVRPEEATEANSPACDLWFRRINGQKTLPRLDRELVDLTRTDTASPVLQDFMLGMTEVSEANAMRDLGAFSVQQQAKSIFTVALELTPGIATHDKRFNQILIDLIGADGSPDGIRASPTGCLAPDDRAALKAQLRGLRAAAASQHTGVQEALDRKWVRDLTEAADEAISLEKSEHNLAFLFAQLDCDRDFVPNVEQKRSLRKGVTNEVYQSRLRWISEFEKLSGVPASTQLDKKREEITCQALLSFARTARHQKTKAFDSQPLLDEETPDRTVIRAECDPRRADPASYDPKRAFWARAYNLALRPLSHPLNYAESGMESRTDEEDACTHPKRLADELTEPGRDRNRLLAARAAAARVKTRALKRLRENCTNQDALRSEGEATAGLDAMIAGYMGCEDIGPASPACAERRSYGWAFCRAYQQRATDKNTAKLRQFYTNLAMASGGALALVATFGGGGLVAALLGIGMTGVSTAIEIPAHYQEIREAERARVDYQHGFRDYESFRRQWDAAPKSELSFWGWKLVTTVLPLAADIAAVRSALVAYREGRLALEIDELIASGKIEEAFNSADKLAAARGSKPEDLLRELGDPKLVDDYVATVRDKLVKPYGSGARDIANDSDVLALERLEGELQQFVIEGRLTAAQAQKLRARATSGITKRCLR